MEKKILTVKLSDVLPDPSQPRTMKPIEEIQAMGRTIEQFGLNNPIIVRKHPEIEGKWMIVDGEMRYMAHLSSTKLSEIGTIDIIPKEYQTDDPVELGRIHCEQMAMNNARINMSFLNTADGYLKSHELGVPIEEISAITGTPVARIKRDMAIAGMPESVRTAVNDGKCPIMVAESILKTFPDNDIRQAKAWEKAKTKKTSAEMTATVTAYWNDCTQEKIDLFTEAKKEPPEEVKKALKEYSKLQGVFSGFEKAGYTNGKAAIVITGNKKNMADMEETFRAMKRAAEYYLNTIIQYKAKTGKLEERKAA